MVTKSGSDRPHARGPMMMVDENCTPPEGCGNCIRSSPLAAGLSDEQLNTLSNFVKIRMLSKGDVLISEGDQDDHLYAVAAGEMEICRANTGGREIVLQCIRSGSLTGELAFLEGLPRTATVRAKGDVCVISLHRHQLEELVSSDPWLAHMIMRAVVRSAHGTVGSLDDSYSDMVRYVSG